MNLKKWQLLFVIPLLFLIAACVSTSSRPAKPAIPSDMSTCLENTPNVKWSENIVYVEGNVSSADYKFREQEKLIEITKIEIARSLSQQEEPIVIRKELCGTAIALQSFINGCLQSWVPIQACVDERTMASLIDAAALSTLTIAQQEIVLPKDTPRLHLDIETNGRFSCNTLKIFQQWAKRGVIRDGANWQALNAVGGCK